MTQKPDLEDDPRFAAATRALLKQYSPRTALPDRIDMQIVDGPPAEIGPLARYPAGPLLFGRMAVGTSVFMDDMIRTDDQEIVRLWLKQFSGLRRIDHACAKGSAELTGF